MSKAKLQVFLPTFVALLEPLSVSPGQRLCCAMAEHQLPVPLPAALVHDLWFCVTCHSKSRAVSYLSLCFSLAWFPLTSQWETLSDLYLILQEEGVRLYECF